jgi:hypothetical protein
MWSWRGPTHEGDDAFDHPFPRLVCRRTIARGRTAENAARCSSMSHALTSNRLIAGLERVTLVRRPLSGRGSFHPRWLKMRGNCPLHNRRQRLLEQAKMRRSCKRGLRSCENFGRSGSRALQRARCSPPHGRSWYRPCSRSAVGVTRVPERAQARVGLMSWARRICRRGRWEPKAISRSRPRNKQDRRPQRDT